MGFKKAEPKQARLKVGMYGPPGSGKTFTALLWAEGLAEHRCKRIAYVDTERGTDFYAQDIPDREIHPKAFDFDCIYTRSLSETLEAVLGLDPEVYGVVVIDSISHMWEAAIAAYEGKMTKGETIPMHAWGTIKRPYKALINFLMECNMDVFILGRQKNVFKTVGGQMEHVGVSMKAEGETQYEPHIQLRMACLVSKSDTTRSVSAIYVEKDRSGIMSKSIKNATFEDLKPILPYLGEEQAVMDNEEKRLEDDAELFEQAKKKDAAKAEKSSRIFGELQAVIVACHDIESLADAAATVKKQKRYLLDQHRKSLLVMYEETRKQIVSTVTEELS
jgi:hypothetical protein